MSNPISKRITVQNNSKSEFEKLTKLVFAIDEELNINSKAWYIRATNNASEIRNNAQNSLLHCYYVEIAKSQWAKNQGMSKEAVEIYCKRNIVIGVLKAQSAKETKAGFHAKQKLEMIKALQMYNASAGIRENFLMAGGWSSILDSKHFQMYLREIELHFLDKLHYKLESLNETLRNDALLK